MAKPPLWVKTRRVPKLTNLVSDVWRMCVDFLCGASQHPDRKVLILRDVGAVAILYRTCRGRLQGIVADDESLAELAFVFSANAPGQRAGIVNRGGAAHQHAP